MVLLDIKQTSGCKPNLSFYYWDYFLPWLWVSIICSKYCHSWKISLKKIIMLRKSLPFSFIVIITYISVAYIIVGSYQFGDAEIQAFILAGVLAILNMILAMVFIDKNLAKHQDEFMKSFMQSTIVRLVIVLAIFFTIILLMSLNHFVFSIGFFILYFLFQIVEIYLLQTVKQPDTLK